MFEIIFNTFLINLFFLFSISYVNFKYFKLNNFIFSQLILYHFILTAFYIFYFKDGAADYKTYLNLTTFNGFNTNSLISADLITTLVALLKYLSLNDLNIILLFSLISLSGIIIFYKNLLKLGLEKKNSIIFFIYSWNSFLDLRAWKRFINIIIFILFFLLLY